MKQTCMIFSVLVLFMGTAHAECIKDGVPYPTGTEIGGFICTADGSWKIK